MSQLTHTHPHTHTHTLTHTLTHTHTHTHTHTQYYIQKPYISMHNTVDIMYSAVEHTPVACGQESGETPQVVLRVGHLLHRRLEEVRSERERERERGLGLLA